MIDFHTPINELTQAVQLFFENVNLTHLIKHHGAWFYAITFVWTFLEGETFVIFAGAAAAQGHINIYLLILVAWLGSFCGDQIYFLLGKRFDKWILQKMPKVQGGVDKVAKIIKKHDVAFILGYRYLYGFRNIASVCMGIIQLDWKKFAFWNFIAAFLWANSFAWTGYFFGEVLDKVLGDTVEGVMIGLVVLLVIVVVGKWVLGKIQKKQDTD